MLAHLKIRDDVRTKKNVSIRALPELGGGVYPCPNFFAPFFYLSKSILNGREAGGGWVIPEFKCSITSANIIMDFMFLRIDGRSFPQRK